MANINSFQNADGANFIDASQTLNIQQNNGSEPNTASVDHNEVLIRRKMSKADLFRVIIALFKTGSFKSEDGSPVNQKDVFEAFGKMLGEDYSDYQKNLSAADFKKTEDNNVFDKLKSAYESYLNSKLK